MQLAKCVVVWVRGVVSASCSSCAPQSISQLNCSSANLPVPVPSGIQERCVTRRAFPARCFVKS
ncbi:hypothetical protein PF005_g16602 [Phytophthora fragariae]|uniref:Secreted protein n=1 Tax=Phytophthora fragariae TaxID=53985 RepID=A0A6A3WWB3_9STRA|nr:hypothetical protein PF003_g23483 [Phytophthora fragariae]KAE8934548.1 hypothetical protein PF009_g15468 [Phytophthora fragariae]KAE9005695.1 hypothetical protein PF011_g11924 [Phytophthora fragariae]KAE9079579.1 hypothetical protein PF007_g23385 [Phytophthora fragariae]KAE9097887.1 hypothetical protein PF010_g15779 [Phytophthora fragariae]